MFALLKGEGVDEVSWRCCRREGAVNEVPLAVLLTLTKHHGCATGDVLILCRWGSRAGSLLVRSHVRCGGGQGDEASKFGARFSKVDFSLSNTSFFQYFKTPSTSVRDLTQ